MLNGNAISRAVIQRQLDSANKLVCFSQAKDLSAYTATQPLAVPMQQLQAQRWER